MSTKEKEIFTTEEAAEMMGCSPSTIEEHGHKRPLKSTTAATAGGRRRIADLEAQRRRDQRAVILDHALQGADFIGVLLSSSCERFRLAVSFSV